MNPRMLDGFERHWWLVGQVAPVNVVGHARLARACSEAELRAALDALQARHPLLRARIDPQGPNYAFDGVGALPLRSGSGTWTEEGEAELQEPFEAARGPLARAVLLPGGKDVLLTIHHVIGDGVALTQVMEELARGLGRRGPPEDPTKVPRPLIELIPAEVRRRAGRAGLAALVRLMVLRSRKPRTLPWDGRAPPAQRTTRILPLDFRPEEAEALVARCKAEGTTVQGALCAALMRAAWEEASGSSAWMGVTSPVDIRRYLSEPISEGMGFSISVVPTFHRVGEGGFWDLARDVRGELQRAIDARGMLTLLALTDARVPRDPARAETSADRVDRLGLTSLAVTNLGRMDAGRASALDGFSFAATVNAVGPNLLLTACTLRGRLALALCYPEPVVASDRASRIAAATLHELRAASA